MNDLVCIWHLLLYPPQWPWQMLISTQRLWGQAKCLIPLPMHSPTNQPIHPPIGKEVFTDYKSSNRIKLSQIVQDLFLFLMIWHPWIYRVGEWVSGLGESPCMCMHVHLWLSWLSWTNRDNSILFEDLGPLNPHAQIQGLMCRWRGVLSQMALLCFWPKKVLLWPSNKKIFCFCTGSH